MSPLENDLNFVLRIQTYLACNLSVSPATNPRIKMGYAGLESLPQTTTEIQSASNSNPVPKTEHVVLSSEILFLS